MFPFLDRVEHECRNSFARESETHPGSGTFPASIGSVLFLSETRRTGDGPVETIGLHDFLHGKRVTHVISKDKTGDPVGNTRKVRCRRENDEPLHSRPLHCVSRRESAVGAEVSLV